MSTILTYRKQITVYILDVCVEGETRHKLMPTGRVYHSERLAIRRARVYCKKQLGLPYGKTRRRKDVKPKRTRRTPVFDEDIVVKPITIPTVNTIRNEETNELEYILVETGKIYQDYDEAIDDAFNLYKRRNS